MRTTLNVDDDVLEVAKSIAHFRRISVGEALSEMARQGMNTPVGVKEDPDTGFLVFDFPDDAPKFTSEDVYRAIEEIDAEDARKYLGIQSDLPEKPGAGRKQAQGAGSREKQKAVTRKS